MDNYFWQLDDQTLKQKYQKSLHTVNRTFNVFGIICLSTVSTYCLETFILDGDHLAFECYRPKWMSFYQLWFFETVVAFLSVDVIFIMDSLLMLFISHTKIEFEMLNQEVLHMLNNKDETYRTRNNRIRRIIEHHNFLLE